jgi:predicted RNase H-like nuclease (RuvC/YqgF family)
MDAGNPDRSLQYRDTSPTALLDQLNENWKKLRLVERAVGDRDRVIQQLQRSIAERDKAIKGLNTRLRFAKVKLILLYSLIGGVAAKGAEELVVLIAKLLLAWMHHS